MARSDEPTRVTLARQVVMTSPVIGSRAAMALVSGSPLTLVKSPPMISLPSGVMTMSQTRPSRVGRNVEIQLPSRSNAARNCWPIGVAPGPCWTPVKRPPT